MANLTGVLMGVYRRSDRKVVTLQDGSYRTAVELGLDPSAITVPTRYRNGKLMVQTDTDWMYASEAGINVSLGYAAFLPVDAESQFTRAYIVAPPPRQINAVKDLGGYMCDAQYLGAATDADIYDSYLAYTPASGTKPAGNWIATGYTNTGGSQAVAGTLTTSTAKGLMLHQSKTQWDLNAGETLLIQHRFFIPDNGTPDTIGATTTLFGSQNASQTVQGIYATVSAAGFMTIGLRTGAATPANQSNTFQVVPLKVNTVYFLQIVVDGSLKVLNAWLNGQQKDTTTNTAITGDTSVSPTNYSTINPNPGGSHMGIGCGMTDAATVTNAQRLFTSHFRMAVLPAGLVIRNPGEVDTRFNRRTEEWLTDSHLVGAY